MGKDKDKDNIWEWMGYRDRDFDGDVDINDVLIDDQEQEELMKKLHPEPYRDLHDDDDDDCDEFDCVDDDEDDTNSDEEIDDEDDTDDEEVDNDDTIWCKTEDEAATLREQIREQGKEQMCELFGKASDDDVKDFYWDAFDGDRNKGIKEALGEKRYKELLARIEKRLYGSKLFLKYHDGKERYVCYDCLVQALLDRFSELRKDYDEESKVYVNELLFEVFELNHERAIKYFEWLLKTFPIEELKKIKTEIADDIVQTLAVGITNRLMDFCSATDDDYMVKYIKANPHLTENYFGATQWEKHSLFDLSRYMEYFEAHGEYTMSKAAYVMYLNY